MLTVLGKVYIIALRHVGRSLRIEDSNLGIISPGLFGCSKAQVAVVAAVVMANKVRVSCCG